MNSADDITFLASPAGEAVLADLKDADLSDAATLPLITRLRKTLTPQQASAAVEQAKLRQKAAIKFGADADRMLFTRDGLEQASDLHIRTWRAAQANGARVIDACCGIGADALSFAQAGCAVLGFDLNPLRIDIARHNAAVLNLPHARFAVHDVTQPLPETADLIFFDPGRRDAAGRRLHHVEQYLPPLSALNGWDAPRIQAKLSPAVELAEIAGYGGRVTFHSTAGDLKEAVLEIDRARDSTGQQTAAVRHDTDETDMWAWTDTPPPIPLQEPAGWLLEPDPALLRAGFVQHLAAQLGAAQIDPTIAYLVSATPPQTAWARAWRIVSWMPFNLKRLKATLRESGIGRITVKKRGHAMTPEQLQAALKLDGKGDERVVVLTRVNGSPAVIVCMPYMD